MRPRATGHLFQPPPAIRQTRLASFLASLLPRLLQLLQLLLLAMAVVPSRGQPRPMQVANQTGVAGNSAQAKPNYLETSRQITGILDRFMSLGYDKRVRPNYGGPPVEVNVTMRILSISSVSEVMMDFTADFYFRQTWHDPRLSFKKLGDIQTLYVGAEVSKKIWLPDTFFGNEKMAYFHEATTPNVFLRIDHSGEVYRSIRLTVTSSCPMNLQYFPMDRQRCTIEAESYGYNVKDIIYRWARKSTAVERDKEISLPQFDIVQTVQKYRLEELSSGTYSRLIAEIHFARRMGYYLIQIYIPSSLIVVISWVSFWLHRNASPARVQLGVTTVLTMTTLMSSTNAALPKISYVKSIDIFLGTCFVMVFAALLEYATVGYLGKRIAMRKAHAQHAQSQAQARLFAQLQAAGAQGEPISQQLATLAGAGPALSTSSPTNAATAAAVAAAAGAPLNIFNSGSSPEFPVMMPDGNTPLNSPLAASLRDQNLLHTLNASAHKQQQQQKQPAAASLNAAPICGQHASSCRHLDEDPEHQHQKHLQVSGLNRVHGATCKHVTAAPSLCAHHQHHNDNHHLHQPQADVEQQQRRPNWQACANHYAGHPGGRAELAPRAPQRKFLPNGTPASSGGRTWCASCRQRGSQTLPRNLNANQGQQQPPPGACCCCRRCNEPSRSEAQGGTALLSAQTIGNFAARGQGQAGAAPVALSPSKGASAAATQAAAAFVNLHRKNKGLPPSTNPNFAQFNSLIDPPHNRRLEIIFGVRPSDIDKYSRVVFPVCFVCFQLMYWIVYLHISAFLEPDQQQQQQLQQAPQPTQPRPQQMVSTLNPLQQTLSN